MKSDKGEISLMRWSAEMDFMKIRSYIINQIASHGGMPVKFPSSRKLAEKFGTSQPTALRTIRDLIADGYLVPCRNGGTISCPQKTSGAREYSLFGTVTVLGKQAFINNYFMRYESIVGLDLLNRDETYSIVPLKLESPSLLEQTVKDNNLKGLILYDVAPIILRQAEKLHAEGFPVASVIRRSPNLSSAYTQDDVFFRDVLCRLAKEGRRRVLLTVHSDPVRSGLLHKAVADACREDGIRERELTLIEESEPLEKFALLLKRTTFDAVIFYPFNRAVYNMLAESVDLNEACRIVIQSESNHRELNFCGLVIMNHLDQAASLLNDNLLQQCRTPETPVIQIKIPYTIAEFVNGQKISNPKKERKDK